MRPFLRCALCPSRGRGIGASGARSQRRRPKTLGSNCKCDLHLASRDDGSSHVRAFFTARDDARLCSTCFSCSAAFLSLRADLRESLADERESKWSVGRRRVPSRNQLRRKEEPSRVFADQLKDPFFLAQPCPAPQALKNTAPPARADVLRVLHRSACLWRLPAGSRRPAGAVPQALSWRRRREIFRGGAGGGRFGGQMGGVGRKMAVCGTSWDTEISSRRVDRVLY